MAAQISTIVATGEHVKDELLGFIDETNDNIDMALALTNKGYSIEFAVPLSYIASKAPEGDDWQEARISIGVYDLDEGSHAPDLLHWQPYRYGGAPMPGSQIFVRP